MGRNDQAVTAPVDVLAVMDAVSCILRINATFDPQRQNEAARAAVAELIEALNRVTDRLSVVIESDTDNGKPEAEDDVAAYKAGLAALARVQGGAL